MVAWGICTGVAPIYHEDLTDKKVLYSLYTLKQRKENGTAFGGTV